MVDVFISGNLNPYELTDAYARGFRSLGAAVEEFGYYEFLESGTSWAGANRPLAFASLVVARRLALIELLRRARAKRRDLILLLKSDDLPISTIPLLRKFCPGAKIAAFHPDDPFNSSLFRGPSHRRALKHARLVDQYFIWSHRLLARLQASGCNNIAYLGFAVDPGLTALPELPLEARLPFQADVSFVGNWDEKREAWLRPLAESGISLAVWGCDYWKYRCTSAAVSRCWRGRPVFESEFAAAIRESAISLNILRTFNEDAENMRTYDIPGLKGVMLAERSEQQAAIFREGIEAFYCNDPTDLLREARRLLSLPRAQLAQVRAAAGVRASEQTYEARARQILATML